MKKICGIYAIRSKIKPCRIYIGSAVNIEKRWNVHKCALGRGYHHSPKLQNHYNKYGIDDLVFEVILTCDYSVIYIMEQAFIDIYSPYFNICPRVNSSSGRPVSNETRKKMSEAKKGRSSWMKGKTHSNETRRILSECKKGKKLGPMPQEIRDKIAKANKGRTCSQKSKDISRKRSLGNQYALGYKHTDEAKAKIAAASTGHTPWNKGIKNPYSEDVLHQMSEGHKGLTNPNYWKNLSDEQRANIIERMKGNKYCLGRHHTGETIVKISESHIGDKNGMFKKVPHNAKMVVNIETGIFYNSIREASESTTIAKCTLERALRKGDLNKTMFRYA